MDIRNKLYQMFILGTDGEGLIEAIKQGLGGIIFFTKDIQTPGQFRELIASLKPYAETPLFFSIDQEGGRVERTENIHNGKKYLSAKFAYQKGDEYLELQTREIARELNSYGINLNFAPCIDVNTNPKNPIIGERAFSSDSEEVSRAGVLVAQTYRENGIIPCAKHFPGHGDADADSHLTLPELRLEYSELFEKHIKPFKVAIENNIEMIMAAHLWVPFFEAQAVPTSLSKNAISYLRNELGYNGVIISDDMVMKGVADFGSVEACEMGIRAGLNMFIYRNSKPETINIIETVAQHAQFDVELRNNIEKSYEKIMKLKQEINL